MKTVRKSRTKQILSNTRRQMNRAVSAALIEGFEVMNQLVPVRSGKLKSRNHKEDDGAGHGKLENDCEYAVPEKVEK